nr:MAG TPA: hypothetical protein [Caudoviricetes sp.]
MPILVTTFNHIQLWQVNTLYYHQVQPTDG